MNLLHNFPSYDYILKSIRDTFLRFPFAVVSAIIGTSVAVYLIQYENISDGFVQQKILMLSAMGLPLFIAMTIFAERLKWKVINSIYLQTVGMILLVAYYITLPEDMFAIEKYLIRFLLLNIGLHFLVAFIPYHSGNLHSAFWQYNKTLFLRFLTASLFSGVLYLGLTIALASADHLFGIEVQDERYFQLWVIIIGIFHPLVFLAGFPKHFDEFENIKNFPKGLKVFTQYILLPLVVLYFVILITYEGKIIFTWNWPSGWVAHLVLWYSVVGILSMLLLYPLRLSEKYKWINIFSTWFFRALAPLLIMLFISIFKRTAEYGITENRYFVIAMSVGLTIVVLYFIISKVKDFRIIPVVICALAFLSSFGPWGAFAISENSQKTRLKSLLIINEKYDDNVIVKTEASVSFDDSKELSSIISYLVDRHGVSTFDNMLTDKLPQSFDSLTKNDIKIELANMMGIEYVSNWRASSKSNFYRFTLKDDFAVNISEFDHLITINSRDIKDNRKYFFLNEDSCLVSINKDSAYLEFTFENDSIARRIDLIDRIIDLKNETLFDDKVVVEKMTFDVPGENPIMKILIKEINGNHYPDSITSINNLEYLLLIGKH